MIVLSYIRCKITEFFTHKEWKNILYECTIIQKQPILRCFIQIITLFSINIRRYIIRNTIIALLFV